MKSDLTLLDKIIVLKIFTILKMIYEVFHLPLLLLDSFVKKLNQALFRLNEV